MTAAESAPADGCARLLQAIVQRGIAHGIEDSLKFSVRDGLVTGRLLVGVRAADLSWAGFLALLQELGLAAEHAAGLRGAFARASALGFAVEDRGLRTLWKVYLEFWDEVRAAVRASGSREPREMHLGLKWEEGPAQRLERAHYTCHPLLAHEDILARLKALYGEDQAMPGYAAARRIVKACARHWPTMPLIYLEAGEEGNPRRSFDINFYRTELRLSDVMGPLQTAGGGLNIDAQALARLLGGLGDARLGHVSGGFDRQGSEFLSLYAERQPLEARPESSASAR